MNYWIKKIKKWRAIKKSETFHFYRYFVDNFFKQFSSVQQVKKYLSKIISEFDGILIISDLLIVFTVLEK